MSIKKIYGSKNNKYEKLKLRVKRLLRIFGY